MPTLASPLAYTGPMRARLLSGLLLCATTALAQERYGLLHSNYGGSDITALNPARGAGQWPWLTVRVAGVDAYAWNSLVAWTGRQDPLVAEARSGFANMGDGRVVMRSLDYAATHRATVAASVSGPAMSLSMGRGTLGLGIRSRVHVSASAVSPEIGNFIMNGLNYAPQHGIRYDGSGLRALGAAWTEVGLNYAHILHARGYSLFSAGVGLRYLMGHAAGAFQVTTLDYTVQDTARLDVHAISARYGYAEPAMRAGPGIGGDVGFVFERTLEEVDGYRPHKAGSCAPKRYRYRLGLSLVDVGGIRYRSAEAGTISTGALSIADYDALQLGGVEGGDSLLATATHWQRATGLTVGLPTALSVQYDQRITDFAYIGFAAVQNLAGRNSLRLRRANSLAITPRLETRFFELAIPVVLNEYDLSRPMVGAMLRIHGVVVGSDHIMPYVSRRDVHAMDLYVRVGWNFAKSPACRKGRNRSIQHRSGSKGMLPCTLPGE